MAQSQDGRDTVQEWVHKQKKETKKRKGKKTKEKELGLGLGLPVTTNETRDSNNAIHVITLSCVLRRQRACNLWPVHSSKGWPNSGRRPPGTDRYYSHLFSVGLTFEAFHSTNFRTIPRTFGRQIWSGPSMPHFCDQNLPFNKFFSRKVCQEF